MHDIPDDGAGETEVLAPALTVPAVEERLKRDLGLGVKTVVSEQTVVGREGKDDLCGTSNEVATGLLVLDDTKKTEEIDEHDTVSKLRPVVETVNLATVLGNSREWKDVVKIEAKSGVNVVNKGLDVLLRALVEGDDSERRPLAAEPLEDALVVLDCRAAVARSGDHNMSTTREQPLQDLYTDRTLADTSEKSILVLERRSGSSNLMEDVEIHASQVATVLPICADLALEMEKRNLVGADGGDIRNLRTKELRR